jgi:hypothetical protein
MVGRRASSQKEQIAMTRFAIAIVAIAAASVPVLAIASIQAPRPVQAVLVSADHPILLKRMVVTATALSVR